MYKAYHNLPPHCIQNLIERTNVEELDVSLRKSKQVAHVKKNPK